MFKVAYYAGENELGPTAVPLFGKAQAVFEKTAAPSLLPEVATYINNLRPEKDAQYVLLNALGAGEFWGSNINGDFFPEAALIHRPDDWKNNPLIDKIKAEKWPYGFPTFYEAKPFLHHRNKDFAPHNHPKFGVVELAAWNDRMKRVELVTRIDKELCDRFGGSSLWDKLQAGMYPDVSMGCKVPYDTCFPAGTLVRTEEGNKPIEEILVGEYVVTHTGAGRRVTQTMRRTTEELVTISASGLPEISSTENHPFLVLRKEQARTCSGSVNGQRLRHSFDEGSTTCRRCGKTPELDLVWAAAETIKPGDYLAVPSSERSTEYDIAMPQARLLGYYLGDGYIIQQRRGKKKDGCYHDMGFGFSGGTSEEVHLERLLSTIVEAGAKNDPGVYDAGCDRKAWIVSVYDQEMAKWLQKWGGRTSHEKRLLEEVHYWSREAKLEIVAGYIETDGSFDEASGQIRIPSVNRGLLLDVQRLLLSIGVVATVCFFNEEGAGGYKNSSEMYALNLSSFEAQKFYGRSTKVKKRDVSWASPQSFFWGGYWLTPVKSVSETEGKVEVFNLSVDIDESYLAEGRAVHNCSICLDWEKYRKAQATFDPKKHATPGQAVLEVFRSTQHRVKETNEKGEDTWKWVGPGAIRGVSITRDDYCTHAKTMMGRILPDGRKVFVYNDYPRFFDISFVFVGADKTAKVMMKVAGAGKSYWHLGGAELAEKLGYDENSRILQSAFLPEEAPEEKVASAPEEALKLAFLGKDAAHLKAGEIVKDVVPSQFAGKAVPLLTRHEPDIPKDILDALGSSPLESALSTTSALGMVLRPREFQRIMLIQIGKRGLADDLERDNVVFSKSDEKEEVPMGPSFFSPVLAKLLFSLMGSRSAFGPSIEKRVLVTPGKTEESEKRATSHSSALLRKMGAAYNGYRQNVMELVANTQDLILSAGLPPSGDLYKLASAPVEEVFTPLSFAYLTSAFLDEMGVEEKTSGVERGSPSKNTWAQCRSTTGGRIPCPE